MANVLVAKRLNEGSRGIHPPVSETQLAFPTRCASEVVEHGVHESDDLPSDVAVPSVESASA